MSHLFSAPTRAAALTPSSPHPQTHLEDETEHATTLNPKMLMEWPWCVSLCCAQCVPIYEITTVTTTDLLSWL